MLWPAILAGWAPPTVFKPCRGWEIGRWAVPTLRPSLERHIEARGTPRREAVPIRPCRRPLLGNGWDWNTLGHAEHSYGDVPRLPTPGRSLWGGGGLDPSGAGR